LGTLLPGSHTFCAAAQVIFPKHKVDFVIHMLKTFYAPVKAKLNAFNVVYWTFTTFTPVTFHFANKDTIIMNYLSS
jgi:hypothetical protein